MRDVDEKTVAKTTRATVYPDRFLPGLKAKRAFGSFQKPFEFELIATDTKGAAARSVPAVVIGRRKEWKSVQTKAPGDSLQRRNTLVRTEVLRREVTLSGKPQPFRFQAKKAGQYAITVAVKGGKAYARRNFYAYGGDYIGWDFRTDDTVQ